MASRATPREPSIFSAASPALRAAIERSAVAVSFAPGVTLFSQSDAADTFFILDAGEIGLFAGNRTASAVAVGAVRLRRVRRADLMAAIRVEPELAIEFIEMLCDRLRTNVEMLEERSFQPLPTRLARRLLHLADKLGPADGVIPVSQADLADFAGATREAVAKTLALWRAQGWVGLARGTVRVADRDALEEIAIGADD